MKLAKLVLVLGLVSANLASAATATMWTVANDGKKREFLGGIVSVEVTNVGVKLTGSVDAKHVSFTKCMVSNVNPVEFVALLRNRYAELTCIRDDDMGEGQEYFFAKSHTIKFPL